MSAAESTDHIEIQLLAETGEWVGHEIAEDEAAGHAEVESLTRMYGSVVQFRLVHRWTVIEVLAPPVVTPSRTDRQPPNTPTQANGGKVTAEPDA